MLGGELCQHWLVPVGDGCCDAGVGSWWIFCLLLCPVLAGEGRCLSRRGHVSFCLVCCSFVIWGVSVYAVSVFHYLPFYPCDPLYLYSEIDFDVNIAIPVFFALCEHGVSVSILFSFFFLSFYF